MTLMMRRRKAWREPIQEMSEEERSERSYDS